VDVGGGVMVGLVLLLILTEVEGVTVTLEVRVNDMLNDCDLDTFGVADVLRLKVEVGERLSDVVGLQDTEFVGDCVTDFGIVGV